MPRLIMGAPPCLTVLAAVLVVAFTGCGEKVRAAPPAPLGPNPAARASDAEARDRPRLTADVVAIVRANGVVAEREDGRLLLRLVDEPRAIAQHDLIGLEELGLATREGGSKNQRAVSARITDAGTDLIAHLRSTHIDLLRTHFFASFSPEELAVVTAGFSRVEESFVDDGPDLETAPTTETDELG